MPCDHSPTRLETGHVALLLDQWLFELFEVLSRRAYDDEREQPDWVDLGGEA